METKIKQKKMTEKYVIGHDAMPKMGRIKTGFTARDIPKLNLNSMDSEYYTTESPRTDSEYSGIFHTIFVTKKIAKKK